MKRKLVILSMAFSLVLLMTFSVLAIDYYYEDEDGNIIAFDTKGNYLVIDEDGNYYGGDKRGNYYEGDSDGNL